MPASHTAAMSVTAEPIVPDASGWLLCQELGLWLRLEDGELVMYDAPSGKRLLTEAEEERAIREAAEAEIQRLRAELKKQGRSR